MKKLFYGARCMFGLHQWKTIHLLEYDGWELVTSFWRSTVDEGTYVVSFDECIHCRHRQLSLAVPVPPVARKLWNNCYLRRKLFWYWQCKGKVDPSCNRRIISYE